MANQKAIALFSVRVYSTLLRAYPSEFRSEYGQVMTQVFKDLCLTERGLELIWLWLRTLLDISISAPGEHMTILWSDLRYGARMLVKNYTFTAVAVVALALGIGANSAIFSVVDSLILHPLPFRDLNRLAVVYTSRPENGIFKIWVSPADFLDWKNRNAVFDQIGFYHPGDINITGSGDPEHISGFSVSTNFFQLLNSTTAFGRTFLTEEEQPGHEQVVILSHGLWLRRFGGDAGVIGKPVTLNGRNHVIVGVMPEDFNYPTGADLWIPQSQTAEWIGNRKDGGVVPIGLLKPGVSASQAQAEMAIIAGQLEQQYPQTNIGRRATVTPLVTDAAGEYTPEFSLALLGASLMVLLIACANIANLQLARATARQKEMAIRSALGASRSRVIRQLLTENIMLSLIGAGLGLPLALVLIKYIKSSVPPDISRNISGWSSIGLDSQVLIFTMAIAIIAGIFFGLAPAKQSSTPDLAAGLKEGGRSSSVGAGHRRLRSILVVSEIALSLILLCGVGLMIKGFDHIVTGCYLGIDPTNVLTMRVAPRPSDHNTPQQVSSFYKQIIDQVSTLPGVESAGAIGLLPASGWNSSPFTIDGAPTPSKGSEPISDYLSSSPSYFSSLHIPLLRGRNLGDQDDTDQQRVAVISEAMARRYFPGEDPIGKRVKLGVATSKDPWLTIVGVVGNTKTFFFDREPRAVIYLSYLQSPWSRMYLTIRTQGDPMNTVSAIKARIYGVDPNQPVTEVKTLDIAIRDQICGVRIAAVLMAFFGVIALILSAAGVYGVMSYTVTQRIHEIGVRIAMGARHIDVLKLIVGQGLTLVSIGLVIGIPAAIALNRFLTSVLFGDAGFGMATFIAITMVLVGAATLASYMPARRAATVDPIVALRND